MSVIATRRRSSRARHRTGCGGRSCRRGRQGGTGRKSRCGNRRRCLGTGQTGQERYRTGSMYARRLTGGRADVALSTAVVRVGLEVEADDRVARVVERVAGRAAVRAGGASAGRVSVLDRGAGVAAARVGALDTLGALRAAGSVALLAAEGAAAGKADGVGVGRGAGAALADDVDTAADGGSGKSLRGVQERRAGRVGAVAAGRRRTSATADGTTAGGDGTSAGGDGATTSRDGTATGGGGGGLAEGHLLGEGHALGTLSLAGGGELGTLDAGGELLAGLGALLDRSLVRVERRRRAAGEGLTGCKSDLRRSGHVPSLDPGQQLRRTLDWRSLGNRSHGEGREGKRDEDGLDRRHSGLSWGLAFSEKTRERRKTRGSRGIEGGEHRRLEQEGP